METRGLKELLILVRESLINIEDFKFYGLCNLIDQEMYAKGIINVEELEKLNSWLYDFRSKKKYHYNNLGDKTTSFSSNYIYPR